ncbi:UNVERIFIED_CONTAM: hypothetical protein NCL1_16747 [Trichonephila clavipes]
MDDNHCTYQMIPKEINFGSAAIYKIIHEELHMKKVACRWVPHNLTEHQKEESARISKKKSLKLFNDGGHRIISKTVTGDETYKPFFDIPTRQESKLWVFEDDPTPTMKYGIDQSIKLEEQKTVTANWYTTKCLPEIPQEINVRRLMLHHINASFHTAGLTAEFLKQIKNLRGHSIYSEEEINAAINAFFHKFQEINGFRHLISGKFVYKDALILDETTLNTPKIL